MTQTPAASLDAASIRVHRKGSGPTLVLLHCLGVDHGLWDIAAAGLEDGFTLLSYDFPGHGETRVPDRGYSIEDLSPAADCGARARRRYAMRTSPASRSGASLRSTLPPRTRRWWTASC